MEALGTITSSVSPLDVQAAGLLNQVNAKDPRTVDSVATGFESLFLSQLMKEMRQTLDEGGLFGKDAGDVYGGMFDLYMGQHLAKAGGLGVAKMVKQQLSGGQAYAQHAR